MQLLAFGSCLLEPTGFCAARASAIMMDIEFDSASKRFTKERQAERKRDLARKSQEQAERAKARAQQAQWEANAEKRRLEEAAVAAEEARIFQRDLEANHGVAFARKLRPVLSAAAEAKGILRRADKISLPYSAKVELEEQQASKNGQLFFELSTAAGRRTHAAILDYSAEEGTVGAPAELLRCLGLPHLESATASDAEVLTVRYRRLQKGVHAKLQPVRHAFHDVADVKSLLEQQLQRRATLTEGDEVTVTEALVDESAEEGEPAGTVSHALRVLEVRAGGGAWEGAVTLIDTDLEVEVAASVEAEEAAAAQEAERQRAEAALAEAVAKRRAAELAAQEEEAAAAAREAELAAQLRQQRDERRAQAEATLAAAPEAAKGGVQCVIRCPDGSRCVRRLHATDSVALLFALVEARWQEPPDAAPLPAAFRLAAQFPRRVVARPAPDAAGPSLMEVGLSSAQESLVVELPVDDEMQL